MIDDDIHGPAEVVWENDFGMKLRSTRRWIGWQGPGDGREKEQKSNDLQLFIRSLATQRNTW